MKGHGWVQRSHAVMKINSCSVRAPLSRLGMDAGWNSRSQRGCKVVRLGIWYLTYTRLYGGNIKLLEMISKTTTGREEFGA